MIGENKTAVERTAAARAAYAHPPGGECRRSGTEAPLPGRTVSRGRGENQRPGPGLVIYHLHRGSESSSLLPIDLGDLLHRGVCMDRTDGAVEQRQQPLRLAQRMREQ